MQKSHSDINREIIARIRRGDVSAYNDLVIANDGLVHKFVNGVKEKGYLTALFDYNDACQTCFIELINNCLDWDPAKGSFSSYMYWKFFGACTKTYKSCVGCVRVPAVARDREKYMDRYCEAVSMDDVFEEEDGDTVLYEDIIRDESRSAEIPDDGWARNKLYEAVKSLSPRTRKILVMRYGLDGSAPMTLEAIGKIVLLSKDRIRQIEAKALRLLRREYWQHALGNHYDECSIDGPEDPEMNRCYEMLALSAGDYIRLRTSPDIWMVTDVQQDAIQAEDTANGEKSDVTEKTYARLLSEKEIEEAGFRKDKAAE